MVRLAVRLVNGANLIAADMNGLSDPYCVLTYGDTKIESKIIMKTLNPNWNEQFELIGTKDCQLHIDVMDYDAVGDDDFLGCVTIPMNDLVRDVEKLFWVGLEGGEMGENIAGMAGKFLFGKSKSNEIENKGRILLGLTPLDFGHASATNPAISRTQSGNIRRKTSINGFN